MRKLTRWSIAGVTMLALSGLLLLSNFGTAGSAGKLRTEVDAIVDAMAKGDSKKADELAKKLSDKEGEVYYVMLLQKPRDKKGYGVGGKANDIIPDGIELMVRGLARDLISGAKLKKEGPALIEMAHRISAINRFAYHTAPKKDTAEWKRYCEETEKATAEFVEAVNSGSTAAVKGAATKINNNCNSCHSKFR
jgi:hypothetical protein